MEETRLEIVELRYQVAATLRKAQCRAVNCDIIDWLARIEKDLADMDNVMTDIIGD